MDDMCDDDEDDKWDSFIDDELDDYIPKDDLRYDLWTKNFISIVGADPVQYGTTAAAIQLMQEAHNRWLMSNEVMLRAQAAEDQAWRNVDLYRPPPQQTRNDTSHFVGTLGDSVPVSSTATERMFKPVFPEPTPVTQVVPTKLENIDGYLKRMRREHPELPPWETSVPVIRNINYSRPRQHTIDIADFHTQPEFTQPSPDFMAQIAFTFDEREPWTGVNCIWPGSTSYRYFTVSHLTKDIGKPVWYILRWRGPTIERGPWGPAYRAIIPGTK